MFFLDAESPVDKYLFRFSSQPEVKSQSPMGTYSTAGVIYLMEHNLFLLFIFSFYIALLVSLLHQVSCTMYSVSSICLIVCMTLHNAMFALMIGV